MNPFLFLCIGLALLVVVLSVKFYRRIRRGKVVSSTLYGLNGLLALTLLIAVLLVLSNMNSYQRLTFEKNIVEVAIKRVSPQNYQLQLIYAEPITNSGASQIYSLSGDEWQLDTRIIKWKGWANLLGMDSYYRLDRLSGRYAVVEQANSLPQTAYSLSAPDNAINIWEIKRLLKSKLPFLDAYYGQSVFTPMKHGARFIVTISQTGLLVRPANEIAQRALAEW
jgi:hypothetical protein